MPEKNESALHLHYGDLKLVMETYQNVVQLNTLLVEQQKQILELQKEILKAQNTVSEKQYKINDRIERMIKNMEKETDNFHQEVKGLETALHTRFDLVDSSIHGRFDLSDGKISDTKQSVDSMNLSMVKEHSGITNKLYVALVGSVLIVLALIGLLTTSLEKFSLIEHVHTAVEKIVLFLNIK